VDFHPFSIGLANSLFDRATFPRELADKLASRLSGSMEVSLTVLHFYVSPKDIAISPEAKEKDISHS
jgi:hypothetical protein